MTPARTWVDLGFYAIDNAIPIMTAIGTLLTTIGAVAATIFGYLNRQHLAKQDIAIADVPAKIAESAQVPAAIAAGIMATPFPSHRMPTPEELEKMTFTSPINP